MNNDKWFCPATKKEIESGLCWEFCFVGLGGPKSTEFELREWIEHSNRFSDVEAFQKVCEKCAHCQWAK